MTVSGRSGLMLLHHLAAAHRTCGQYHRSAPSVTLYQHFLSRLVSIFGTHYTIKEVGRAYSGTTQQASEMFKQSSRNDFTITISRSIPARGTGGVDLSLPWYLSFGDACIEGFVPCLSETLVVHGQEDDLKAV